MFLVLLLGHCCLSCFLPPHFPARALRCHSSSQATKGLPSSTDFMSDPVVGFALYLCNGGVFLCLCMCVRLCICAHVCRPTSYTCWCVNLNAHLTVFFKRIRWEGGARAMIRKEKSEGTLWQSVLSCGVSSEDQTRASGLVASD